MKWMRLKMYLLPLIMQEVEYVTEIFINLISDFRETGNTDSYTQFLELRAEITERIQELELFFEDNIRDVKVSYIEKARLKLKKLLMYDPDVLNKMQTNDNNFEKDREFEDLNVLQFNRKNDFIKDINDEVESPRKIINKVIPKPSNKAMNSKILTKTISNATTNITQKNIQMIKSDAKSNYVTIDSNKANSNAQKKCLSDRKQPDSLTTKPSITSPEKKLSKDSVSPRKINEIQNKNPQLQKQQVDDLVLSLVNDNSFIMYFVLLCSSRDNNDWKEIGFKLILTNAEYKLLIREKANKVSLK